MSKGRARSKSRRDARYQRAITRQLDSIARDPSYAPIEEFLRAGDRPESPAPEVDYGCCALDDERGSGHEGPCGWKCSHCGGTGRCPACGGRGDDGSGLDFTCTECGGGECPHCNEGMVSDD